MCRVDNLSGDLLFGVDECGRGGYLQLAHGGFMSFLNLIHKFDEEMYPGRLFKTMLINVPFGFPSMWSLAKSFMDPMVASKVFDGG